MNNNGCSMTSVGRGFSFSSSTLSFHVPFWPVGPAYPSSHVILALLWLMTGAWHSTLAVFWLWTDTGLMEPSIFSACVLNGKGGKPLWDAIQCTGTSRLDVCSSAPTRCPSVGSHPHPPPGLSGQLTSILPCAGTSPCCGSCWESKALSHHPSFCRF